MNRKYIIVVSVTVIASIISGLILYGTYQGRKVRETLVELDEVIGTTIGNIAVTRFLPPLNEGDELCFEIRLTEASSDFNGVDFIIYYLGPPL